MLVEKRGPFINKQDRRSAKEVSDLEIAALSISSRIPEKIGLTNWSTRPEKGKLADHSQSADSPRCGFGWVLPREEPAPMECGIKLQNFNDIKEGDVLEAYRIEEVARTL